MKRSDGIKLAKSLTERLQGAGYPGHQVYLFGSAAKGTQHTAVTSTWQSSASRSAPPDTRRTWMSAGYAGVPTCGSGR